MSEKNRTEKDIIIEGKVQIEAEQGVNKPAATWAADSLDELEDWIEKQGIQLRY